MQIRNTTYPVGRAIQLVQAISRDVSARMFDVLRTVNLMKLKYASLHVAVSFSTGAHDSSHQAV